MPLFCVECIVNHGISKKVLNLHYVCEDTSSILYYANAIHTTRDVPSTAASYYRYACFASNASSGISRELTQIVSSYPC
jgi:hypothetical protein